MPPDMLALLHTSFVHTSVPLLLSIPWSTIINLFVIARLKINIDYYQAYILCLIKQQLSQDEIMDRLKHDFDIDISPRTLRNRLSE